MKPKEKRDRLFKSSRPHVRPLQLFEDGKGKDIGILWAAYKAGSFDIPQMPQDLDRDQFIDFMLDVISRYSKGWIVEDKNREFKEGYGAVGFILAADNGWELEPHFEKFSWASARNVLRTFVSFLQMMRYSKEIGIVNLYTLETHKNLFDHVSEYGVLRYVGKMPHGDIRGDRYIYYTRGKKWAES